MSGRRAAARPAPHRSSYSGAGRRPKKRRPLRVAAALAALLVLVLAAGGTALYAHLNGNIHGVPLFGGGKEKPDQFGRTPINMLVIGSDARENKADCKLGGDCGGGGKNADVEMLVHISADRSNATVMSIPRDTVVQLPSCKDPKTGNTSPGGRGQINSSLANGPSCTVATVHQLTGVPIDHFAMVDFAGVVTMSDAVGGVGVCVSDNVYDTYSHLKLKKGRHTLKGKAALEFVRSRHGFGDGGDLGRTYAQHLYLGSLIRTLKSAGTLADPAKMYDLADAATKALTVDNGIASVSKLTGLGEDLNKVPSNRITFTTMQTAPDPSDRNRLVVSPLAQRMFSLIRDDKPLTGKSGKKSKAASSATATSAPVDPASVPVRVENGTGIGQRAATVAGTLTAKGFRQAVTAGNAPSAAATSLTYGPGEKAKAQAVAKALGMPAGHLQQGSSPGLLLVIGADWPSGATWPGGSADGSSGSNDGTDDSNGSGGSDGSSGDATKNAHAETASGNKKCAPVSRQKTVELNGVPMTPPEAYAEARSVPDSAP